MNYMGAACSCRLIGSEQTDEGEKPVSEPDKHCPFIRLASAVEILFDADLWLALWTAHRQLAEVEYFANAVTVAVEGPTRGRSVA